MFPKCFIKESDIIDVMKKETKIQIFLSNHNKKELFLLGFYISFLIIMILATIIDFMIENTIDAYIELFFILLTIVSLSHYLYKHNITVAIYGMVILATLTTYALLISNHFNISIFHSIVPLGYFLLFSLKRSLIYTAIHQSIVIAIYTYATIQYPKHVILHDPSIISAIVLASLMIVFFGIVYHISVENSYRQLNKSNKQKELLLKEVHHRVKNNLNIISSILGLQLIGEEDKKIKHLLEKNRLRILSIAMVHEQLYKNSDFETIHAYTYIKELVHMAIDIYDYDIELNINKSDIFIPFEKILKLGIITNELTINSIKHAFKKSSGHIYIALHKDEKHYYFSYRDSGSHIIQKETLIEGKQLGLKLVRMMVDDLDANLTIETQLGIHYKIRIPHE
jgi:two-component sensor histidine kinase